ncbi:MAG: hypothetical protein ACP5F3_00485 [Candidatus Syntrophosphaera sp.]
MKKCLFLLLILSCGALLFADPPADPVLISPPDGATGLDPNAVTLVWETPLTEGMPIYSDVFIWAYPDVIYTYYDFYVYYPDQELDLSAQPGVDLGHSVSWQWAVIVYG